MYDNHISINTECILRGLLWQSISQRDVSLACHRCHSGLQTWACMFMWQGDSGGQ